MKIKSFIYSLRTALLAMVALGAGGVLHAQQMPPLPIDTALRMGKLENGLTYFIRKNALPEGRAHFYIAQKVGSMQEEESQRGLAHFLEHMAFNGTTNFPGKKMINWLETIGVRFGTNLNAYTGFDETVYTIMDAPVARTSTIDSCILILRDWSAGIALEEKEIDNERGVIQEEWRSRENGNLRVITEVLRRAYPGSRYGERMPIGLMEVVRNFKYQEIRDYYKRWYRPDLQAVIVVGDINPDQVEASIKRIFADVPKPVNPAERVYLPVEDHKGVQAFVVTDPEAVGTRIAIDFKHDALPREVKESQFGVVYDFIQSIATSIANERFSDIVRKPNAPFIAASMGMGDFLVSPTKSAVSFSAVAADGQYKPALDALVAEIERIRQHGFTEGEYKRAVADFMVAFNNGYKERDKRKNETFAQAYSHYFTQGGNLADLDTHKAILDQLSTQLPVAALNQAIQQMITKDNILLYLTGPKKDGLTYPSDAELSAQFAAACAVPVEALKDAVSNEKLMDKLPKAGKIVKEDKAGKYGSTVWTLSNGIKVVVKATDYKEDQILMLAQRPGGTLLFDAKDLLEARAINGVINLGGVGKFDATALPKVLSGRIANVTPMIGRTGLVMRGNTTPADLETMMQLLYLNFTAKGVDAEAFKAYQERTKSSIKMRESNPLSSIGDSISSALYPDDAFARSLSVEDVDKINYQRAMELYAKHFGDASGFQFYFVGNVDLAKLRPLVEQYIASLPATKKKYVAGYDKLHTIRRGAYTNHYTKKMETPMGLVFDLYSGKLPVNSRSRLSFEILGDVLTQVYTETLREEEGGTYGAQVGSSISYHPEGESSLQIIFQTDPAKAQQLNAVVARELDKVVREGLDKEKFDKVIANLEKEYAESVKENSYWLNAVSTFYYDQRDIYTDYLTTLKAITPEEVQAQLKELLKQGNRIELMLLPEQTETKK